MYPRYRFVRNTRNGQTSIGAATSGEDGMLNNAGGQLFSALAKDPAASLALRNRYPQFFASCQAKGWLDDSGLQGKLVEIDLEYPLTRVQIELTRHCNLKCSYCYSFSGPTQLAGLPIQKVIEHLRDASALGCMTVDFTGGEPLLYKSWREAISEARSLGLVVTVHTNGTACTPSNLESLAQYGVRRLQISFDSHLPHLHDQVRGQQGAFVRSTHAVIEAKALGINVRVVLMVHKYNIASIGESVEWFSKNLGVKVALDRIVATGGELTANYGISTEDYFEAVAPLLSRTFPETRVCSSSNQARIEPECGVGQSLVYITADGEIALCPTMTSREISDLPSDGSSQGLYSAWLIGERFTKLRGLNCENISHCPTGSTCGGGCRSNAYVESKRLEAPDVFACNINKNRSQSFVDFNHLYQIGDYEIPKC